MNNPNIDQPILVLKSIADIRGKGTKLVANHLLDDPRFKICSGSSKPFQHHYGDGGLARHTMEVVELCFTSREYFFQDNPDTAQKIDEIELFLAALFHDAGKMHDYAKTGPRENWVGTPHKRLIHHLSRSALIWTEAATKDKEIYDKYHEPVLHAILSHHGSREAGSPVAPKTRVAWLVHLCDNLSARINDAETFDVVHKDQPQ